MHINDDVWERLIIDTILNAFEMSTARTIVLLGAFASLAVIEFVNGSAEMKLLNASPGRAMSQCLQVSVKRGI